MHRRMPLLSLSTASRSEIRAKSVLIQLQSRQRSSDQPCGGGGDDEVIEHHNRLAAVLHRASKGERR